MNDLAEPVEDAESLPLGFQNTIPIVAIDDPAILSEFDLDNDATLVQG